MTPPAAHLALWRPHGFSPLVGVAAICGVVALTAATAFTAAKVRRGRTPCVLHPRSILRLLQDGVEAAAAAMYGLARTLGLRRKHCRILLLGLDNAGKTALCHALAQNKGWPSQQPRPDHHVLHHAFELPGFVFDLVDPCHPICASGGHQARCLALWEELLHSRPDGIMFVVDAADSARLHEASDLLHWALQHPVTASLPVLVLGNKVDLPDAINTWDLKCRLGLEGLSSAQREALLGAARPNGLPLELRQRISSFHPNEAASPPRRGPVGVRMCSIKRRWSADAGMVWLAQQVVANLGSSSNGPDLQLWEPSRSFSSAVSTLLGVVTLALRSNSVLSRQAALLPLFHD